MTWFGVSPLAWLIGALAALAVVVLLHLLRVRLRRVEVDTLLFLQLAGAVRQPRVLPGRPSRWLSLLLALLAALAAWTAFADPRPLATAPSRIVLVEPASGQVRLLRLAAARELVVTHGLGPRGAVVAAGTTPAVLLRPGAAVDALDGAALPVAGSTTSAAAALRAAGDLLRAGDELVWIGGAPPDVATAVPVRPLAVGAAAAIEWRGAEWHRTAAGALLQLDITAPAGGRATLRAADRELAAADFTGAPGPLLLGPVPVAALTDRPTLQVAAGSTVHVVPLPPPPATKVTVHVAGDVTEVVAAALQALCAVMPGFELTANESEADVLVRTSDDGDPRPCLLLEAGAGSGERLAAMTADAPVPLSLRDRRRREGTALPAVPGATVWVEDLRQGAPLVQAGQRDDRHRIRIVDWLLDPPTHADVPLLLGTALGQLAGSPSRRLAIAGMPWSLPATYALVEARTESGALLPAAGRYRTAWDAPAATALQTPDGRIEVDVLPAPPVLNGDSGAATPPILDGRGGDGSLVPWFVAALLLLVAIDALLFHRGRLP